MNSSAGPTWIAVDVGNSRIKLGSFVAARDANLLEPIEVFDLPIADKSGLFDVARFHDWCDAHVTRPVEWFIASVCDHAQKQFTRALGDWSRKSQIRVGLHILEHRQMPLEVRVDEPASVGIDRLLSAVAANRLRYHERAAIVVDLGTAITVNLVEADSTFAGGAILPGLGTSAKALHDHTAALPLVAIEQIQSPPELPGKSTTAAIDAGLYWGAVGAIRELVAQMSAKLSDQPDVFVTGGGSWQIAELLGANSDRSVRHMPNLVLSGIAVVAEHITTSRVL